MELVVAGDLLHQPAALITDFEQHEVAQVVQQQLGCEEAAHHLLQFELQQRLVVLVAHRAPRQKALAARGERAHARVQAVGDHQRLVEHEQVGNLRLVGVELVERRPDVGLLRCGVLQLDHGDRQPVDEAHQIGPPRLLAALHGELVHHQKAVGLRLLEVDQAHTVAALLAARLLHLDRQPVEQRLVKAPVGLHQRRLLQRAHAVQHLVEQRLRQARVQTQQRLAQAADKQHLAVVAALGRVAIGRDVRAVPVFPAGVLEPGQRELLELVFSHRAPPQPDT
jgi:hypothetical protein